MTNNECSLLFAIGCKFGQFISKSIAKSNVAGFLCLIYLHFLPPRTCWKERKWTNFNFIFFYCFSLTSTKALQCMKWPQAKCVNYRLSFQLLQWPLLLHQTTGKLLWIAEDMPVWGYLPISIASNLKLIALRTFISDHDINGLNEIQDQFLVKWNLK